MVSTPDMATNYFNGTTDLGSTREMFRAFATFGRLSPDEEFGALHGALHTIMEDQARLPRKYLNTLARQIEAFRERFGEQLSPHEVWILERLTEATVKR